MTSQPAGKALWDSIVASKKVVYITESEGGNAAQAHSFDGMNGKGSDANIYYNPSRLSGGTDDAGSNNRPSFVGLGHELGHVEEYFSGTAIRKKDAQSARSYGQSGTTPLNEKNSIKQENKVRDEHGLTKRSNYVD